MKRNDVAYRIGWYLGCVVGVVVIPVYYIAAFLVGCVKRFHKFMVWLAG